MGQQPESTPDVQQARARQYALCTVALHYDRVTVGAEGIFDQALTNGLAAIVAHNWPGEEMNGSRVRSAADLLEVIRAHDTEAAPGEDILHVRHPGESEPTRIVYIGKPRPYIPGAEFEPSTEYEAVEFANYTVVNHRVLRSAIDATQAIRHARAVCEDTAVSLSDEQIEALDDLSDHPALHGLMEIENAHIARHAKAADRASIGHARRYLKRLDDEELDRRSTIDYTQVHSSVDRCPVCDNESLAVDGRDPWIGEVPFGQCVVCSYERTDGMAGEIATGIQLQRAADRPD